MGDHVIGLVAGGVCKTIAMGSELIAGNKGKQSAAARRAFEAEQSGGPQQNDSRDDDNLTMQEWALDDIESELTAERRDITPTESNTTPAKPEDQALTFINDHENELQHSSSGRRPIPQAVLIPQRRPGNRQRGFIRAHAPILNEYAGISQDMFMDFLRDFDKASKSSPVFNVINMACFGIGLVPSSICLAVSTAVGTVSFSQLQQRPALAISHCPSSTETLKMSQANQIAQELQMRFRTNTFLDKINEALFMPCGLLAMVMAYKPDSPDDLILQADTTSPTDRATFKTVQVANNKTKQLLRRIRMHSGKATDVGIPECAPLVYPALDLALASNRLTEQKSLLSRNAEIVNDYLDRRAQTDFTQKHPTSKITSALPPQEKPYGESCRSGELWVVSLYIILTCL